MAEEKREYWVIPVKRTINCCYCSDREMTYEEAVQAAKDGDFEDITDEDIMTEEIMD